jgi:protein TonB
MDELPDAVPIPAHRPKPAERKDANRNQDQDIVHAEATKPKADDPIPDTRDIGETVLAETTSNQPATRPPGMSQMTNAEQRWLGRLAAHLERRKRYPISAQSRRQTGLVQVRFSVAPDGAIMMPELVSSSGAPELDTAALELLARASPAPRPPPDINTLVTVPINFTSRR